MVDLGSVPDWLAAVAASSALLFARSAVIASNKTNDAQSDQLRRLEQADAERVDVERRWQADKVAAWFVTSGEEMRPSTRFINTSGLPIYDVVIRFAAPWGEETIRYPVMSPQADVHELRWVNEMVSRARLRAQERRSWQELYGEQVVRLSIDFTDISGNRWRRDHGGRLTLLPSTASALPHT